METLVLKRDNILLKRDDLMLQRGYCRLRGEIDQLKKGHVLLKAEIEKLKGSDIWRHVGEHDDRLDEVDGEIEDMKTLYDELSDQIRKSDSMEVAMDNMQLNEECADENDWEDATLAE